MPHTPKWIPTPHLVPPPHPNLLPHLAYPPTQVAIVTAAGYPGEAQKFESRLSGLLDAFERRQLSEEVTNRCGTGPVGRCTRGGGGA